MRRLTLLLLLVVASCAAPNRVDPVTGRPYWSPLPNDFASQDEFIKSNHFTAAYLAMDGGELPEPEIRAVCDAIVKRIAAAVPATHRRGFSYELHVTASPAVNAYTYGGGRLHCYLGLFAKCRDVAELAGILAHEMGHNSHDHFGQQLGRGRRAEDILSLGGLLGRPGRAIGGLFGGTLARAVLMTHSREQERAADDRAVDYTSRAGIDPDGLARFFARMQGAEGLVLFQSHPNPDKRVPRIRERIAQLHGGGPRDALRTSPAFEAALARAKVVMPYYEALYKALAGEDPAPAIAAADRGIKDLGHHAAFHFWKGALLSGDTEKALPHLRRAAELDRSNYMIPTLLCRAELENHNLNEAAAAATRSIDLLPSPQMYITRGLVRSKLKRKEEAWADFDAALELVPENERRDLIEFIHEYDPDYVPGLRG